jgi:hypothetical protein
MLCKDMFETREIFVSLFAKINFFIVLSLHSETQAGCGSKRLTNMYITTLLKYQTSKYLKRKRKLYIRTANNVVSFKLLPKSTSIQIARLSLHSSELAPPTSPASEYPPPLWFWGGHTRLRERGQEEPIRTKGQTLWYSRYSIIHL